MRLIQYFTPDRERRVGVTPDGSDRAYEVRSGRSVREIALQAHRDGVSLARMVDMHGVGNAIDYEALVAEKRLLVPLDHPDPHHMLLSVTGLTHLGSAKSRDAMHAKLQQGDLTDSMKMFELGLKGGRPAAGAIGVQSEWVYKGNGNWCIAPEGPLELPGYAASGGEEAEIVGLYAIGDSGEVLRVGYALGNEFSDHRMERVNYLYLAHSKLRKSSFGPELLVGELPADVSGTVRIRRGDQVVWQDQFLSGEENMCHSLANLEHHHFKYSGFRSPGDVHVHFFGASVLSHASGVVAAAGDLFEIDSPVFGRPLRNTLSAGASEELVTATAL